MWDSPKLETTGTSLSAISAFDSSKRLLAQSTLTPDAVVVANAASELTSSQGNLGALVADSLQLEGACSMRIEAGGASGGAAIQVAANLIKSGQSRSVLVVGVEKMRDIDPSKLTLAQGLSEHAEYCQFFGITFPSMNALVARMYMKHFNIDRESSQPFQLSLIEILQLPNTPSSKRSSLLRRFLGVRLYQIL